MSIFLALMFLSAGSDQGYSLPQCNETAVSGAWWPDIKCAESEFKKADAELNRIWKSVIKRKTGIARKKFILNQRTWLKKMNDTCQKLQSDDREKWFIDYEILACRQNITNLRVAYLKKM